MLRLSDVLEALSRHRFSSANRIIADAVVDSRLAIPGSLFVALPGERLDGHEFIGDALAHGAWLALAQRMPDVLPSPLSPTLYSTPRLHTLDLCPPIDLFRLQEQLNHLDSGWKGGQRTPEHSSAVCLKVPDSLAALQQIATFWRNKLDVRVIGVTGSVGKSSTKELIAQVLGRRYRTLKNVGNLNNEIGLPLSLLRLTEEHERAVLEMGFYVLGEIAQLCQIAHPQVGVITNIGAVHAERAGSQAAIAQGKAELVESLPARPVGVAVLNYDDPLVRRMAAKTQARVFFYGTTPQAELWADGVEGLGLDGIRFWLHYQNPELNVKESIHLKIPLIGRHSVHTALRAAAVGLVEGLTWQEIIDGLREDGAQLRLVAAHTPDGALILDDTYNASPESMLAALNLLADLGGYKIAVLGDMRELGSYEQQGHEMVGARAAEIVDELVTVGDLGRLIAESARRSGLSNRRITMLQNSDQAIELLKSRLKQNDVVLIKGSRAMQMDQIVAGLETK